MKLKLQSPITITRASRKQAVYLEVHPERVAGLKGHAKDLTVKSLGWSAEKLSSLALKLGAK